MPRVEHEPAPSSNALNLKVLEADIRRQARSAGGTVGLAAWRLDGTGPRVLLSGEDRFPMASTFKVAVAGAILDEVDHGRIKLEEMVAIDPSRMVPSSVITDNFIHPGVSLSVYNLLEVMLTESDNTAADMMMDVAGGPAAVNEWVRRQGVVGLRVDRDTAGLVRDFLGLPPGPIREEVDALSKADPTLDERSIKPSPAFDDDPRDTSTPVAMATLLTRVFSGKALSASSTEVLTGIMGRCHTGDARLRGRLPPQSIVAEKTGTLGGTVNDVGLITLPNGAGKIVIAAFVKKSGLPVAVREQAIADMARSVRDFYLYTSN